MLTTLVAALTLLIVLTATATAGGYPTSRAALRWHPPAWWLTQAACIHKHESAGLGWHLAYRDYRGHRSVYSGGMQFLHSTWLAAGATGHAWQWSPREQLYRAYVVWKDDHGSWGQWGTAKACGLG